MTLIELTDYWNSFSHLHSLHRCTTDTKVKEVHLAHPRWGDTRADKQSIYVPFRCEGIKINL